MTTPPPEGLGAPSLPPAPGATGSVTGGTAAEVHATWSSVEASEELWFSVIEVDGRWLVDGRVFPGEE